MKAEALDLTAYNKVEKFSETNDDLAPSHFDFALITRAACLFTRFCADFLWSRSADWIFFIATLAEKNISLNLKTITKETNEKWMKSHPNFEGLVLGCMDSYDSEQSHILQHFSSSTRLADFCTVYISKFQRKNVQIFAGMKMKFHFSSAFFDEFCDFSAKF